MQAAMRDYEPSLLLPISCAIFQGRLMMRHYIIFYYTTVYYIRLYHVVFYYIVLYCTVLISYYIATHQTLQVKVQTQALKQTRNLSIQAP